MGSTGCDDTARAVPRARPRGRGRAGLAGALPREEPVRNEPGRRAHRRCASADELHLADTHARPSGAPLARVALRPTRQPSTARAQPSSRVSHRRYGRPGKNRQAPAACHSAGRPVLVPSLRSQPQLDDLQQPLLVPLRRHIQLVARASPQVARASTGGRPVPLPVEQRIVQQLHRPRRRRRARAASVRPSRREGRAWRRVGRGQGAQPRRDHPSRGRRGGRRARGRAHCRAAQRGRGVQGGSHLATSRSVRLSRLLKPPPPSLSS